MKDIHQEDPGADKRVQEKHTKLDNEIRPVRRRAAHGFVRRKIPGRPQVLEYLKEVQEIFSKISMISRKSPKRQQMPPAGRRSLSDAPKEANFRKYDVNVLMITRKPRALRSSSNPIPPIRTSSFY